MDVTFRLDKDILYIAVEGRIDASNAAEEEKKIFNIKVFRKQLENKKQQMIEELEKCNYLLNPSNYLEEKNKR